MIRPRGASAPVVAVVLFNLAGVATQDTRERLSRSGPRYAGKGGLALRMPNGLPRSKPSARALPACGAKALRD